MKTLSIKVFALFLTVTMGMGVVAAPVLASVTDKDIGKDGSCGECKISSFAGPDESFELSTSFVPESVIGKDDRKIISDTTKYPYSAIAHMRTTFPCGHSEFGSGFLISDNTMLTAGHCIICPLCGYKLSSIQCYFGYNSKDGSSFAYTNGCKNVYYDDNYMANVEKGISDPENDYAIVEFEKPVGKVLGHFGVKAFSNSDLTKQEFKVCGYTTDGQPLKESKSKLTLGVYYKVGRKKKTIGKEKLFSFTADAVQGNSGGPVFNKDNYISGIIVAESTIYSYNVGRRITKALMKFMADKKLIDNSSSSKPGQRIKNKIVEKGKDYTIKLENKSELLLLDKSGAISNVSWESTDPSIVSVDYGIITAKKIGTVYVHGKGAEEIIVKVNVVYKDVKDASKFWYKPTYDMTEKNVVKGYNGQTLFKPANDCTRAQMVTFLWRLAGSPKPKTSKCVFSDVKKTDYFYKAVLWGNENGIVEGYKDGTFGPQKICKRKHAVTFLWRLAGTPEPASGKNKFSDIKKSDYFYNAVLWASSKKIVAGYEDGTFQPDGNCLRRQMVTFIFKFDSSVDSYIGKKKTSSDTINEKEPNNSYLSATEIKVGKKIKGECGSYEKNVIGNTYDEDWFVLNVSKGKKYKFEMPVYFERFAEPYMTITMFYSDNMSSSAAVVSDKFNRWEKTAVYEFEAEKTGKLYFKLFYLAHNPGQNTNYIFTVKTV